VLLAQSPAVTGLLITVSPAVTPFASNIQLAMPDTATSAFPVVPALLTTTPEIPAKSVVAVKTAVLGAPVNLASLFRVVPVDPALGIEIDTAP
jgi:hypothetical protein